MFSISGHQFSFIADVLPIVIEYLSRQPDGFSLQTDAKGRFEHSGVCTTSRGLLLPEETKCSSCHLRSGRSGILM